VTIPPFRSVFKYIKNGRLREGAFRGKLFLAERYGELKYNVVGKINREKFKIINVNGSPMWVYLGDPGISRDLYLYRTREKFSVQFFEKFVKDDDVVVDIGANIGYYVLLEHRIATRGQIFACEPVPFNRTLLERNLELNGIKDVQVLPLAFGDGEEGEREFYIYDRINWASFHNNAGSKIVKTITVKTTTVDAFTDQYLGGRWPTLLRMDVEGHEYEIIKGAQRVLAQSPNLKIFMEIHPHLLSAEKLDEMLTTLERHNFEVAGIVNDGPPHEYPFLNDRIWNSIEPIPYGFLGTGYKKLRSALELEKGNSVFFEKVSAA
jgi:FkbM family methyltransferase